VRPWFVTAAVALAASCGYVGPPQPPALNMPEPIVDLGVIQTGDRIVVHFTTPVKTTENLPVTKLSEIELAIGPGDPNTARSDWEKNATRYQIPVTELGPRGFEVPSSAWVGQPVVVGIRTTGISGRESEWSNYRLLAVGTPLVKPTAVVPKNTAQGVALKWNGNAPRYRVLRSVLSDPMPVFETAGESDMPEFLDIVTTFGVRYSYLIQGIAGESRESPRSETVEIETIDTFAPAVPAGVSAASAGKAVDLSWTPSNEEDLGGYNLYRAVDDGAFVLYQRNLELPAYHDTSVESGKRYRYTVSAFDKRGNESDRSEEKSALVE